MSYVIEGMDQWLRQLDELTFVEARRVLPKALKNAGQLLVEEEEQLAPHRSGKLARNIGFRIVERTATSTHALIGPTTKAFYASFQNWGTRFQSGLHFVERAILNVEDKMLAVMEYDINHFIDQAVK